MSGFAANAAVSAAAVAAALGVTYALAVRWRRHSVVDVTWGLAFTLVAVVSFVLSAGEGEGPRRWAALVLTSVWGLRLAWHIGVRARGKGEDPRYAELLERSPGRAAALRKIYLPQGVAVWLVSLPVQATMYQPSGSSVLLVLGTAVWLVGFVFETVGDRQLAAFKADPANRGRVMDRGLWRYTRHPNYFGDATVWWGLFVLACGHWTGLLTVVSPLVMTYFLTRVTGVALLDRRMAASKPGYADYMARTSGFFPRPPRRNLTT